MDAAETRTAPRGPAPPHAEAACRSRPFEVLTLAMSPAEAAALAEIAEPERFRLQPLGDPAEVGDPACCRPSRLLPALVAAARALPSPPDAVIAFDDYPARPLCVAFGEELGLPGPPPAAALHGHQKF